MNTTEFAGSGDVNSMSYEDLKKKAREMGIEGAENMSQEDLKKALQSQNQ